jgi:putative hydrolase of the HAD superfamily
MAFRVVIFDLGGVLVKLEPWRMLQKLAKQSGQPEDKIQQVVTDPKLIEPFELGRMSPRQFFEQLTKRLGLPGGFDELVMAWNSLLSENTDTTWILQRLRERYTLAVLSNTDIVHDEYIRRTWPIFSQIHHWIASYPVGRRKPEPGIYQLPLREADAPPSAAVYVDDTEEFVLMARRLGLTAIHFTDGLKLEHELRAAGLHV